MDVHEESMCIREVLAGHSEGFRPLVEAYRAQIIRVVMKMTGRPDIAEEISQEAFVKAYTKLHTFRGESRFSTWVTQIAIHLCHDLHRQERHWAPAPNENLHADFRAGTDEQIASAERDRAITRAMSHLPPKYREVMVLRYSEGYSLEETARILGKGLSAVKMTAHRGLEMLRQELAQEGIL